MTLYQTKKEARDLFSYILLGCPDFPPDTGSTTEKEFEKLINLVETITAQTKSDSGKQWLRLSLQQIRRSWKNYADGNLKAGRETIQQGEEYFKNAFSKKPIEVRFVSGQSGAAFDSGNGFPS